MKTIILLISLICVLAEDDGLEAKIKEYETHVRTATEWAVLERQASKSRDTEWPLVELIKREIIIEKLRSSCLEPVSPRGGRTAV